jgi:hypothetical protein
MGDRSNIAIKYSTGDTVYLYGHWMGKENVDIVERTVQRGVESGRITDESYFVRMLFTEMLGDDIRTWRSETGFGIAPYLVDNDYGNPLVWVDYTQAERGVPEVRVEDY